MKVRHSNFAIEKESKRYLLYYLEDIQRIFLRCKVP